LEVRSRRTTIALINEEDPPLKPAIRQAKSESREIKKGKGRVYLEKIITEDRQAKIKNQFNKIKEFLAFGLKALKKESLVKISRREINRLKYAKNFIIERNLIPHFLILTLGVVIVLCNVLIARGADHLYDLIPANPNSQIKIASSIDVYTTNIPSDAVLVEKVVTLKTDSSNEGFNLDVKSVTTEKTDRPETQVAEGPREKTIGYTIQSGDTLSGLGMKFNVKIASIKYSNDLINIDLIKPGDTIKIPPEGWEPSTKEIAAKEKKLAQSSRNTVARNSSSRSVKVDTKAGSKSNGYPYGYCTYYAATKRAIPSSWGNAGQWLSSAKSAGYSTGSAPVAGAVVVTRESWWGHVGYVESVSENSFTISEMNYNGWGVVSYRTLSVNSSVVKGFVY